jgi:hypothetical protein
MVAVELLVELPSRGLDRLVHGARALGDLVLPLRRRGISGMTPPKNRCTMVRVREERLPSPSASSALTRSISAS